MTMKLDVSTALNQMTNEEMNVTQGGSWQVIDDWKYVNNSYRTRNVRKMTKGKWKYKTEHSTYGKFGMLGRWNSSFE